MRNQLLTDWYEPGVLAVISAGGDPSRDFGQATHYWQKEVCPSSARQSTESFHSSCINDQSAALSWDDRMPNRENVIDVMRGKG
jgi:hypothetical protein